MQLYIVKPKTVSIQTDCRLICIYKYSDTLGVNRKISGKFIDISRRFGIKNKSQHINTFERFYVPYVFCFTHSANFDDFSVDHRVVCF